MKSIIYLLVLTIVLTAGIYITSCNSPAKKMEKENVGEDRRDLSESETEFHVKKIVTPEEWNVFKKEQELKMKEIELRIAELREKIANPETGQKIDSAFQEKIVKLEQKNNILRAKIKSYESNQTDWESFKREFNHDMEELGKAFKDLTIDNKK